MHTSAQTGEHSRDFRGILSCPLRPKKHHGQPQGKYHVDRGGVFFDKLLALLTHHLDVDLELPARSDLDLV